MENNYLVFKGLFEIWKNRNFDLYFYFQEIFAKALNAIEKRVLNEGYKLMEDSKPRYRALFVPVGFSIENVAIISALLKPDFLRLAFTETTKNFHRNNIHLISDNILKVNPQMKITDTKIISHDHKYTEHKIVEWIEEMKTGYGLAYTQMAIDLTAGTKPMSIGASKAAFSYDDIDAFYLDVDYDDDGQHAISGTERLIKIKKDKAQEDKYLVFVIMPFAKGYDEIYQWIEKVAAAQKMKCIRADKEIFTGGIMDKVRENILRAGVLIADLTEQNLNVYYELGLSHGASKKVIMLTQNIDSLPFDLKHLRMVIYRPDNKPEFISQLSQEIDFIKTSK